MRGRRGHAVLTGLSIIPMIGFSALSVDIGLQRSVNAQLQTTFDLAAVSGAQMLDGTQEGLGNALNEARHIIESNTLYFNYRANEDAIIFGKYEDGNFYPLSSINYREINSIKISDNHTYSSILSKAAFGVTSLSSHAESIAVRPTGGVAKHMECYLPFAIPSCHFASISEDENPPPLSLDLSNLNTIGWGMPGGTPDTKEIIDQLSDQCSGGTASVYEQGDGDTWNNNIYIANGQNNNAVRYIKDIINERNNWVEPSEWPSEYFPGPYLRDGSSANLAQDSDISARNWGNNIEGVVPIVDMKCGSNAVGSVRITGWTYVYIYDTKTSSNGGKNIWMQFDVVNEYDLGYGNSHSGEGNIAGTTPALLIR